MRLCRSSVPFDPITIRLLFAGPYPFPCHLTPSNQDCCHSELLACLGELAFPLRIYFDLRRGYSVALRLDGLRLTSLLLSLGLWRFFALWDGTQLGSLSTLAAPSTAKMMPAALILADGSFRRIVADAWDTVCHAREQTSLLGLRLWVVNVHVLKSVFFLLCLRHLQRSMKCI